MVEFVHCAAEGFGHVAGEHVGVESIVLHEFHELLFVLVAVDAAAEQVAEEVLHFVSLEYVFLLVFGHTDAFFHGVATQNMLEKSHPCRRAHEHVELFQN